MADELNRGGLPVLHVTLAKHVIRAGKAELGIRSWHHYTNERKQVDRTAKRIATSSTSMSQYRGDGVQAMGLIETNIGRSNNDLP
jgi:hypothetical protein